MKLKSVDTVYLHFPDPATPVSSVLSALADFYDKGKFKELGLSKFPAGMVADICHLCDKHGWIKPTVYQGIYYPLTRNAETELNAALNYFGMRFYAYNPLAGGILSGRYTRYEDAPEDGRFTHRPNYQGRYWKKTYFDAVNKINEIAQKHGISIVDATYRWMAYHSMLDGNRGDSILIGASKIEHLTQNIEALNQGALPEDVVKAFEEAWTITKGDSPAYFTLYKGNAPTGGK